MRAGARTREISLRYALGAKPRQVIQQLLAEGLLLGLAGGIAGIVLAPQISAFLTRILWAKTNGELAFSSHPDFRVLIFNFALTLLVSLLFSLAPAVQFWRPNPAPALKQQMSTIARGPLRLRRALVAAQISLSLLLLIAAGLFVRTLRNLKTLNVGFTTENLITFTIDPRLADTNRDRPRASIDGYWKKSASFPACASRPRLPTLSCPTTILAAISPSLAITPRKTKT